MEYEITVTGMPAYYIERAERSSFYGIHGNKNDCHTASRLIIDVIKDYLKENNISWTAFGIRNAKSIDTSGTKTPYKAIVTFYTENE